jgi:hypothetical protein
MKDKSRDLVDPKVSGGNQPETLRSILQRLRRLSTGYPDVEIKCASGDHQRTARQGLFAKLSSLKTEAFLRPAWRSRGAGGCAYAGVTFGALAELAR